MNDIVVHTITKRRINKTINNKSVGNTRINLPERSIIHRTLVFNMMNEKLKDKVVAIELAGNNILIANNNDNFKNELISLGFEKVEPYYSISIPVDDVEKRAVLFQKLMELGTLFSNGKDWSPSEIVRYYRDKGLIKGDYLRIAWRNKQDFDITTE